MYKKNKYLVIIIFTFIISFSSNAQTTFFLKSKTSKMPIKYGSIYKNNNIYTTSDSLGVFQINESDIDSEFQIKCIGFKDSIFFLNENNPTIYLDNEYNIIEEVVVRKKLNKSKIKIGSNKKGKIGIVSKMEKKVAQMAKFFPNENNNKNYFLTSLSFKTTCSDKNRLVNLKIYSVGENNEPNKSLLNENIIIKLKKGINNNKIDLKDYNILFPKDGIFIIIERLLIEQNKVYSKSDPNWFYYEPSFSAEKESIYKDTWYLSNDKWTKANNYSLNFELTVTD
jgi:hypothetical protein